MTGQHIGPVSLARESIFRLGPWSTADLDVPECR